MTVLENQKKKKKKKKKKKELYLSNCLSLSPTKPYYWNVFLPICNNFSELNCLDKPVFDNVRTFDHTSFINNTVTNKIKHFPHLFTSGPPIVLKRKWYYFLS